jgi:hypothetical protein
MASQLPKNSRCDEIADLAEMIHADLEHAVLRVARQRGEAQGHAPVVVVRCGGAMRPAERAESETQQFLGRGLAGTAGDADDLRRRSRSCGAGEILDAALGMGHGQQRRTRRKAGRFAADERGAGLRLERGLHEVMAVAAVALQRDEEIAGLERARVDGQAVHLERPAGNGERRALRFFRGPERHRHAARPPSETAASMATLRSEKGRICVPTIWPVS